MSEQIQETYPRIYKVDKITRRFLHGLAIFLIAFFLGTSLLHLVGVMKNPLPPLGLALGDAGITVIAVLLILTVERRVILYEEAIEVTGAFSSRKLSRGEIRGRRMGRLPKRIGGGSYYIIVPADGSKPELKLPPFLHLDKCFFSWVGEIPEVRDESGSN